jgi:hypothetical protein
MQKEMVFYLDSQIRKKLVYLLFFSILSFGMINYAVYLGLSYITYLLYIIWGVVFGRIMVDVFSEKLKPDETKKIAVKIDEKGITDNILTKKLIKWEDVKDIKLGVASKATYLLVFLENEHEYQKDLSLVKNTILKLNLSMFGTGFSLQLALPEDKRQEFLSFCIQNLSKSRLNKQISKTISDN